MADKKHLRIIERGPGAWNDWRRKNPQLIPSLSEAYLPGENLSRANLFKANLREARLHDADLSGANLREASLGEAHLLGANLRDANLRGADLHGAHLSRANLNGADLGMANLSGAILMDANLSGADLSGANLYKADLIKANLIRADLIGANLRDANLREADLHGAHLSRANFNGADLGRANLSGTNLIKADLSGADLRRTLLVETDLRGASLAESRIYGASVWDIKVDDQTKQQNLVITPSREAVITVDNIKVAQFIYLLFTNKEIRDVIDTIGRKGVLLLGRFTGGRIAVLERLREELRKRGFVPMVFNFDKPEVKDFTETVRLLAGLSHFVIADITCPRSAPLELQATVPECMIPFVPILEKGEEPFAMFRDLWIKHREWVFDPIRYPSVDRLIEVLDTEIVRPAQARFADLLARKAEQLGVKDI